METRSTRARPFAKAASARRSGTSTGRAVTVSRNDWRWGACWGGFARTSNAMSASRPGKRARSAFSPEPQTTHRCATAIAPTQSKTRHLRPTVARSNRGPTSSRNLCRNQPVIHNKPRSRRDSLSRRGGPRRFARAKYVHDFRKTTEAHDHDDSLQMRAHSARRRSIITATYAAKSLADATIT